MLEQIRRNVRNPWIQAILGLIILVFILFFGWGMDSQKPTYVAKVNGEAVDFRAYQQAYNGLVRLYQEAYQDDLTGDRLKELGLGRRAADQLVDQILLLQEAGRRRLKVSDQELKQAIDTVGVFQNQGAFDKTLYLQVLDANRITPLEYEASKRRELTIGKIDQAIRGEATVSDAEVEAEYRERHTQLDLEYALLAPEAFHLDVQVSDAALAEFYEAEKEAFRSPERRAARYVFFAAEDQLAAVAVTEAEVKEEFGWRAGEFGVAEAVHAQHILFRLAPGASPEQEAQVRAVAEKVRAEALKGADFGALARVHSEDPGSKDRGGDLGFFARGEMVPEFEAAAFGLAPGAVSELVKTTFGFHVLRVVERREARAGTFEEARGRIEAEIRRRKAGEAAYAAADAVLMDLEDKRESWESIAKVRPAQTTPPLPRDGVAQGIEKAEAFVEALFAMAPDKVGELLETPAGTYLLSVARVEAAAVPPLSAVRAAVEARFRQGESRRLAEKRARELLDLARKDGWEAAVKRGGLTTQRTGPFAQKGGSVPQVGWSPALKEAAFAVKEVGAVGPEPVEVNGAYCVYRVASRTEADLGGLADQREKLRGELLPRKQSEHFDKYLEELRKRADIEINEELLY